MLAVIALRAAIVAPAVAALGPAAAMTTVAVIAIAALRPTILSAILAPIWSTVAAFALGWRALAVRYLSRRPFARAITLTLTATVAAAIAIPPAALVAPLPGWCGLGGRCCCGICRARRCLRAALSLVGSLTGTLIWAATALISAPVALRAAIDRAAFTAMAPPWPPDFYERNFRCH